MAAAVVSGVLGIAKAIVMTILAPTSAATLTRSAVLLALYTVVHLACLCSVFTGDPEDFDTVHTAVGLAACFRKRRYLASASARKGGAWAMPVTGILAAVFIIAHVAHYRLPKGQPLFDLQSLIMMLTPSAERSPPHVATATLLGDRSTCLAYVLGATAVGAHLWMV
eukprot:gene2646-538_t